jgi:short-subunit dehydrogenase
MVKLEGKHIVVTGASAGIGAEVCRQLGAKHVRVVLAARRRELLDEIAEQVRKAGGEAKAVVCDVTDRGQVFALADNARSEFGEIDAWINNAGAGIRHLLLDATEEDMLHLFRLNCLSSLWAYQAVIPHWLDKGSGGHMIDVCSLAGKAGIAYSGGYAAAKHALSAIGDAMRQELIGTGINVSTIYPGLTVSDFHKARPDRIGGTVDVDKERLGMSRNPLTRRVRRAQSTEYVARLIVRCLENPRPTVYPHGWGNFAVLLNNLLPGLVLKLMSRERRPG